MAFARDYSPALKQGFKITPLDILGGAGVTGNIYYVVDSAASYYNAFLADFQQTYRDGTATVFTDIQTALNNCTAGRGDYVVVLPSTNDFSSGTGLTMSKSSVHLICATGLGAGVGAAPRAATIGQASPAADTITISGRGCEVAGFWIRGGTEKKVIALSNTAAIGTWIHHNEIAIYSTSSSGTVGAGIIDAVGCAGSLIEFNHIFSNAGTSATITAGISDVAGATRGICRNNVVSVSNGCTMTNGIQWLSVMGIVSNNIVAAHQASGSGEGAGILTKGIRLGLGTVAVNNSVAISTAADAFVGGTTSKGGVNNYDSLSGGTLIDVT